MTIRGSLAHVVSKTRACKCTGIATNATSKTVQVKVAQIHLRQ